MTIVTENKQNKLKLDSYDKKIFMSFTQNARKPKKQLAKEIGISLQRLNYKINRLHKELSEPVLMIDYNLLDIGIFIILVEQINEKTINNLKESKSIYILAENVGKYQYVISILSNEINEFCTKYLSNCAIQVFPIVFTVPDSYNPFKLEIPYEKYNLTKTKPHLDKTDYKILLELSKNPLKNNLLIGTELGIDRRTVKTRIDTMLKKGVIEKFRTSTNVFRLGFLTYFLKINFPVGFRDEIIKTIRSDYYSGFIYGSYTDIFMWYMPPSHKELQNISRKLENVDKAVKVEVIQTVDYKINGNPLYVLDVFEERINENI